VGIPMPGDWPVDPQYDIDVSNDRIWVDGCFDFAHHGTLHGLCTLPDLPTEGSQVMLVPCYKREGWARS